MASEAVAAKAAEERGKQADAKVVDFESIAPKNAAARKTVRSGAVYDLDAQERRREGVERAGRLREELGEGPVTGIEGRLAYRFAKRAFDVAFSAAVLVAFCWLFAIIAALIKADDPKGPVLFKQRRVGKDGQTFQMYKFRSMCVDAEERLAELRELNEKTGPVFKMAEDPRVTRVGRWLRKLSLASVIIGTPGAGEPTNSLSSAAKTSLDQQFYDRRPEVVSCDAIHYTSPEFLSFALFGGSRKAQIASTARVSDVDQSSSRWHGNAFSSMSKTVACDPAFALGVAA